MTTPTGADSQPTTPAPDRTTPSDPQAAAPESEWDLTEAIATSPIWKLAAAMAGPVRYSQHSWNLTVRSYACDLDRSLRRTGLVITAPDAPANGMVCISREAANWASWALTGVLADSPEATVVPVVREARDEIYAAIAAAAGIDPA